MVKVDDLPAIEKEAKIVKGEVEVEIDIGEEEVTVGTGSIDTGVDLVVEVVLQVEIDLGLQLDQI